MTIPALVASLFLSVLFLQLLSRSFILSTNILWSILLPSAENPEKKWKHSRLMGTQRTILFLSLAVWFPLHGGTSNLEKNKGTELCG